MDMDTQVNRKMTQKMIAFILMIIIFHLASISFSRPVLSACIDPPHSAIPLKTPLLLGEEYRQGYTCFWRGLKIHRTGTELYLGCPGNFLDHLSSRGRHGDLRAECRKRIFREEQWDGNLRRQRAGVTLPSGWWGFVQDLRHEELGFAPEEAGALGHRWGQERVLAGMHRKQLHAAPCQPGTGTAYPYTGTSEDANLGVDGEGCLSLALQGLLHGWLARAKEICWRAWSSHFSLFPEHLWMKMSWPVGVPNWTPSVRLPSLCQ